MISKHGAPLLAEDAREALSTLLIPCATLITPNLHEAAALAGIDVCSLATMREAARRIGARGCRAVLVKGGHLEGIATDILLDRNDWYEFPAPRIETVHTHGTGCTYSAAITALLARGLELPNAVARAKTFIWEAIRTNPGLGHGAGPVNHHAPAS
jgi:hydroxymethylpyrimidine/phosphomethylpyrimidine kinase